MAKYKIQFFAVVLEDAEFKDLIILGGQSTLTLDVEASNVCILVKYCQKVIGALKMTGLSEYRFEAYELLDNRQRGKLLSTS